MKTLRLLALVMMVLLLVVAPALAQTTTIPNTMTLSGAAMGAGLGAGITLLGAGFGFGKIGSAALESMARQPEVAPRVQTAMIVIAALLECATFFALIICILVAAQVRF